MQISIYMPSEDRNHQLIPNWKRAKIRDQVRGEMLNRFGGVTSVEGKGYWKNAAQETFEEPIEILTSFWSSNLSEYGFAFKTMNNLAITIVEELDQETVMFTIDNEAYFNSITCEEL